MNHFLNFPFHIFGWPEVPEILDNDTIAKEKLLLGPNKNIFGISRYTYFAFVCCLTLIFYTGRGEGEIAERT